MFVVLSTSLFFDARRLPLISLGVDSLLISVEDEENVYILLEFCCNQSLNDQVKRRKRLTEVEVQCYGV